MRHELDNDAWRTRDLGQRLVAAAPDLAQFAAANADLARRLRHAGAPPRDRGSCGLGGGRPPEAPEPAARARPGLQHHGNRGGTIVRDGSRLVLGDELRITFAKGWAGAEVKQRGNHKG